MEHPKLLTTAEIAEVVRKDPTTVTRWCRTGVFAKVAVQIGRGWLVPESFVLKLINREMP